MMKIVRTLLITGLSIPLFLSGTTLTGVASSETDGEVGFANNTSPPPIVNPLDPDSEIKVNTEGTAGALNIDYATNLDFGMNKISTSDEIYYASSNIVTVKEGGEEVVVPNFVQVTDNRGTKAGWTLSITASDFTTEDGKILTGAYLTFNNANVYTPNSTGDKPTAVDTVVLEEAGTSYPILRATNGQGTATWGVYYAGTDDAVGEKSITLSVPGTSTKLAEAYTSILIWNLAETPY